MAHVVSRELKYFDGRGLAEQSRLLLADAAVEYKDTGFTNAEWPTIKPTTPLGQVPILIENYSDGTQFVVPQSMSILRHLARVLNRYGSNEAEHTRCDFISDQLADWGPKFYPLAQAKFANTADVDNYVGQVIPGILAVFEKLLEGSKSGYFVGNDLTYPDLMAMNLLENHTFIAPNLFANFPRLKNLHAIVRARPNIAKYISTKQRPIDPTLGNYLKSKVVSREIKYFDTRGRAEASRALLEDAGVEYKDTGIQGADWPALKPSTPFGQLPILIETLSDGSQNVIPQSMAIARHLARSLNRYGTSEAEKTRVDYIMDEIGDWGAKFGPVFFFNKLKNQAEVDTYLKDVLPGFLNIFEKLLDGSKSGYLVGNDLTVADLLLDLQLDTHAYVYPQLWEKYPNLHRLHTAVRARPNLAKYFSTKQRPAEAQFTSYGKAQQS